MFGAVKTTHYICRLAQNVFNLSSVKYFSWHPVETIIDSMCCVLSDKNLTASHLSRSNSRPECREIPRKSWLFSLTEKVCDGGKFFAGVTSRGISVRCPWLKIWCSEISMFFFLCLCVCVCVFSHVSRRSNCTIFVKTELWTAISILLITKIRILENLKADSHIACRANATPCRSPAMPCR